MHTTFFSEALDSLVYPSSYARVARQPLRRTVRYLAWLIGVFALASAVLTQVQVVRWARSEGPDWLRQWPTVTIAQGHVSSPVRQPWVREWADGQFVTILDTTGTMTAIDARYPQGALLTDHQLLLKRDATRTSTYDLSRVRSFTFNEDVGRRWLRQITWWGGPLLWLATSLYLAVAKPVQILLFSVWALLVNGLLGRGWDYHALWTMGAYALTGSMLLAFLTTLVTPSLPLGVGGLIVMGAYVLYLTLAVTQRGPGASREADA